MSRAFLKTTSENMDVLSGGESSGEFSGFSDHNLQDEIPRQENDVVIVDQNVQEDTEFTIPRRVKSTVSVSKKQKSNEGKSKKKEKTKKKKPGMNFDVTKLSPSDLTSLRQALGINLVPEPEHVVPEYDSEEADYYQSPLGALENLPNIHVEISDAEQTNRRPVNKNLSKRMVDALFNDTDKESDFEEKDWDLPKLKAPETSKPVNSSLANLINTACIELCDIENVIQKYKIPENCTNIGPPSVNKEVWKILDKRAQGQDKGFQDIQTLVAASIVPIIRLSEILKPQINSNLEAKAMLSDALTLLGQVQLNVSLRRRYVIRPNLNRKYFNLCNIHTPITEKLFGDDLAKELKNCEALTHIGRDQRFFSRRRGYGYGKAPRRGFQNQHSTYQNARSHPYSGYNQSAYQYQTQRSNTGRQPYYRGRGRRTATATAPYTSPNDQV